MRRGFKKGFKQGYYIPINPYKWIITKTFDMKTPQIKYRSSWEHKFFVFMDLNNDISKCNSEGIIIPYINPITLKLSKYYMDAVLETNNGVVFLIEIKPLAECSPPIPPRNKTEKAMISYQKRINTYIVNQAKWEAAEIYAKEKGFIFKIITEKELGV